MLRQISKDKKAVNIASEVAKVYATKFFKKVRSVL